MEQTERIRRGKWIEREEEGRGRGKRDWGNGNKGVKRRNGWLTRRERTREAVKELIGQIRTQQEEMKKKEICEDRDAERSTEQKEKNGETSRGERRKDWSEMWR